MTRVHFEAVAAILEKYPWEIHKDDLVRDLETYFASINENFQPDRFAKACGVEPDTGAY